MRSIETDLNVIAKFAEDNYMSYWRKLARCTSNLYLGLYHSKYYLTIQLTDYDNHEDPSQNLIFEVNVNENDICLDLYKELTNKMEELPHNIEDNYISWEEYEKSFKLKWDNIINLDLFQKAVGKEYACQYITKMLLNDNIIFYDRNHALKVYTWIGCSNKSVDEYPNEIVNFLLYCFEMYELPKDLDSNFLMNCYDAIECLKSNKKFA